GQGWSGEGWSGQSWQRRRPEGLYETGAGVAVGIIDFGFDVAHPNLRANDGTTRVLALWDQRMPARSERPPPEPYGYGVVHTREEIDAALRSPTPFRELGYYPADADRADIGAHATHVTDIAAGSGRVGPMGMAPGADLILVHLADRYTGGLATLGDSSHLLEAAHFVVRTAGTRPWVINLSMGRHGGPHKGCTLLELALDDLLRAGPGRFVAQSAGNYHDTRTHASGLVTEGETTAVRFVTDPDDVTPNELEVWYSGDDEFVVHLDPPGSVGPPVALGDCADVVVDGQVVGRIYHRAFDPNCGDSHIDAFLSAAAPAGIWRVRLTGLRVADGVFHAWLERDEACGACQARFVAEDASSDCTLGTLANGRLPLVVGAYDARSLEWPPTPSSSAGPTRDGRDKPDVGAPGKNILAARSAPRGYEQSPGLLVAKTGTSMSTPHVTGAVALCLQRNPRLDAAQIRRLVLSTADPPGPGVEPHRLGHGYLNVAALVAAVPPLPSDLEATAMDLTAMDLTGTRDLAAVDAAAHDGVHARFAAIAADPALAYRELLYRPGGGLAAWLGRAVTVVGRPGQRLRRHLQPGDVVLSVVLGDRDGPGECAVLDERRLIRSRLNRPGQPSGWYGVTGSRTGGQSIRVLDPAGVVPPGQLVLRLATTTPDDDRDGGLDEDS
ncbi:MAG TPA: S8 family serine peptidase, partial [Kineosporiaceae bacterium]|nr:S8 family serine peptidase [Kineosporiaceae bacterium]